MTAWYRARFLFSSFGPLYLLLCVALIVQHHWAKVGLKGADITYMVIAAAAFALSILTFVMLRRGFASASPSRYAITQQESLDETVLGYMLAYVPPLMIDDLASMPKVAPAVVFYSVMMLIMFRTDTIYINPYFLLFGYRLYRIKLPSDRSAIAITRKSEILPGENVTLHEINPSRLYFVS